MDMERVIQEVYELGYHRGYEKGKNERVQGDDLIRREDAITVLCKSTPFDAKGIELLDKCEAMIRDIPSADRPRGEWIKRHGTINCSVCKRSNWSACFEDTVRSFKFCPNCGARMKGADYED